VRRVEDDLPARPRHASQLAQAVLEIRQVRQQVEREDGVEGRISEREGASITLHKLELGVTQARLGEHLGREVEERNVMQLGEGSREAAVAAADVEDAQALSRFQAPKHVRA